MEYTLLQELQSRRVDAQQGGPRTVAVEGAFTLPGKDILQDLLFIAFSVFEADQQSHSLSSGLLLLLVTTVVGTFFASLIG